MPKSQTALAGVVLSHPEKVLYPEQGITKLQLAKYYEFVARWMIPEIKDRPLSLVRCPTGRAKKCFFQKHPGESLSPGMTSIKVREKEGSADYLRIRSPRDLIYLAQMNVLEIHCWGSRAPKTEKPDRIVFDLDPDTEVERSVVVKAARQVQGLLKDINLKSFPKLTGGKGIHIVVPIAARYSWEQVKAFSHTLALALEQDDSDLYVATASKQKRKGKIFVDYLRNGVGATSIAVYSTRARPGAPLAVPIAWKELKATSKFDAFTISNIQRRLTTRFRDPWAEMYELEQLLPKI